SISNFPIRVDPVNVIFLTLSLSIKASVASFESAITKLNTPLGKFISSNILAISMADFGDLLEGFKTTVHPAASAGANFLATIDNGKFQGVIAATTPIGCLITII